MRFDPSLAAFALESSGAAARAIGISHTLTLSAGHAAEALQFEPGAQQSAPEAPAYSFAVDARVPDSLTVTL